MRKYDKAQLLACVLVLVADLIVCGIISVFAVIAYQIMRSVL